MDDLPAPRRDAAGLTRDELLKRGLAGAGALGAAALLAACGSDDDDDAAATATQAKGDDAPEPKVGGTLRVGLTGGGAHDSVDPVRVLANPDFARCKSLYDSLTEISPEYELVNALAEEFEPNETGDVWTIRIKDGVEFHDGKTLTADDVIFSLSRYTDPAFTGRRIRWMEPKHMKRVDDRTLRLDLDAPYATVPSALSGYQFGIMPEGFDEKKPVGTGGFVFGSFTPGERSVFTRNPNYWRDVWPEELQIINFTDANALQNALVSNQVDAIDAVPFAQAETISTNPDLKLLVSETGAWRPFTMRVDVPPFNDPKLRQAMRLVIDREAMVEAAFQGQGRVGNDLYAPYDPAYNKDIPQREQDLEQAQALFEEGGVTEFDLDCAPIVAGMMEASQVLAEQAKAAGVTINLRKTDTSTFYGDKYLTYPFAVDFWAGTPYIFQCQQILRTNECHWADGRDDMSAEETQWLDLVTRAQATVDEAARTELIHQAQEIEHEAGGYIVWGFPNVINAMRKNVNGLVPDKYGGDLNSHRYFNAYFA